LRATAGGDLVAPIESPDPANRCAALREVVPQSLRQQQLVCLSSGHVSCPRYLRGTVVAAETPRPAVRMSPRFSPAIIGSLLVLILAFSASVAFVVARGGLALATPAPSTPESSPAIVASQSPTSAAPSAAPTPAATAVPSVTSTAPATAVPTAAPTPVPSPTATPTPTPPPTPRPSPTSDRYALLRPCPDTPRCWIYTVRSGDNLFSIANYFGVSLESIYDRNPWARSTGLRKGQELRLPPPTR
jgi:hypothetical protein